MAHNLAKKIIINDLNKPLSELLQMIVEHPIEIASFYESLWSEQHSHVINNDSTNHYYEVRAEFNKSKNPQLFLYLLARCIKGSVRYNADGQFNQSPDKRRFGTRPEKMRNNIFGVSNLLKGKASFYSLDYREIISKAKENDLIYMDPPYQGVCGERDSRYFSGISHLDFVNELQELNAKNISYIVSYDGRRGDKVFGELLPNYLQLSHVELDAGRSSQSTLLGIDEITYESLYISEALKDRLSQKPHNHKRAQSQQSFLIESIV